MNILSLELSLPSASCCLWKEDAIVSQHAWHTERNHDEYLFPALRKALDALGDAPLHYILVGAGPGSYGGIRVALAAAVGISTVKGAKTVAICSWEQGEMMNRNVISDARRGGWTIRRKDGNIQVLTRDELIAELAAGLTVSSIEPEETLRNAGIQTELTGLLPTAEGIVRTWLSLSEEEQARRTAQPAEPIYVRPPHITQAKRKPWECKR